MGYRKIIETIETFSDEHYQINDFVNNHPIEINTHQVNFPLICAYPGRIIHHRTASMQVIKLFVVDLLTPTADNEKQSLDVCQKIGKDFIDRFRVTRTEYGFMLNDDDIEGQAFSQNYQSSEDTNTTDFVCGWFYDLYFDYSDPKNECDAPWNPLPGPTPPTPACPVYDKESDYVFATRIAYDGKALEGSLTSDAVWCITKIETNYEGNIIATEQFTDVIWDDRYSL